MDDYDATGGRRDRANVSPFESLVAYQGTRQDQRLTAYAGFQDGTHRIHAAAPGRVQQKPDRPKSRRKGRVIVADGSTPAERYALARHLAGASRITADMEAAAACQDFMAVAEAGVALEGHLRELWRLRKAREDEWAEIVNFLQSALARGALERVSEAQCQAIASVLKEHLAGGVVDEDQPARARRTLREAGLDPWQAISQPEGTADDGGDRLR